MQTSIICGPRSELRKLPCFYRLTAKSPFSAEDEDEVRRKVAKVEYKINKENFGRCSQHPIDIIKGVFKRIPE